MLSDLQRRQLERAESTYLTEPEHETPRCACCGTKRNGYTELFLYKDEPWCYECLEYEGLQPDDIDEMPIYDEEVQ